MMKRTNCKKSSQVRAQYLKPDYRLVEDEKYTDGVARFVTPYVQEFVTFAKGRWLGREVQEVMAREFGGHPPGYWANAFERGSVRVNDQRIDGTHKFRSGDRLLHRTHRHEPPVFGRIKLVGETESLVAVSKPPSLPMHACGAYRFNSLEYILNYEHIVVNQPKLYLLHRLDRVTSGLVVLAKSKEQAQRVSELIQSKAATKIYLARVRGRFPADVSRLRVLDRLDLQSLEAGEDAPDVSTAGTKRPHEGDEPSPAPVLKPGYVKQVPTLDEIAASPKVGVFVCPAPPTQAVGAAFDPATGAFTPSVQLEALGRGPLAPQAADTLLCVSCPIAVMSHRDGVHACDPAGRPALSIFRNLGYDAATDSSLVECRPFTGRTHQLRLHLQLCGNPIANDPCYGGELFFGEPTRRQRAIDALVQMRRLGVKPLSNAHYVISDEELGALAGATSDEPIPETTPQEPAAVLERRADESEDAFVARTCTYCSAARLPEDVEHLVHCDGVWLHALQYSAADWAFRAPLPAWSAPFFPSSE